MHHRDVVEIGVENGVESSAHSTIRRFDYSIIDFQYRIVAVDAREGADAGLSANENGVEATPFHEALQPPQPFKPLFALHHSFFSTLRIERSRASTDSQRRNWTRARLRFCSGVFVLK